MTAQDFSNRLNVLLHSALNPTGPNGDRCEAGQVIFILECQKIALVNGLLLANQQAKAQIIPVRQHLPPNLQ